MVGARRFLVVDDHRLVASALGRALRAAAPRFGDVAVEVTLAFSLAEALEVLARHDDWTGFLFDVQLGAKPDRSGFVLLDEAMARHPYVPAVMISGLEDPDVVREAGNRLVPYVLKPVPEAALRRFVESALARRDRTDERLAAAYAELVVRAGLSPAEAAVLRLAVAHRSRETILEKLDITENTLKTHVKRILKRTGSTSMSQLIEDVLQPVLSGPLDS